MTTETLRDVTIEELFSWRQDTAMNSRQYLGNRGLANQATYEDIKRRCDRIEIVSDPLRSLSFSDLYISVDENIPNGIIRPRQLTRKDTA